MRTWILCAPLAVATSFAACGPSTPPATTPPTPSPLDAAAPPVAVDAAAPVELPDAAPAPAEDAQAPTASDAGAGEGGVAAAFVPTSCQSKSVSLAKDVQPLMGRCSGIEGCHGPRLRTAAGTYAFLVNAKATECTDGRMMAAPGDPQHSYVIDKLTNKNLCKGDPMPKVLRGHPWTQLPPADVQTIYDWICEGAPNN